MTTRAAIDVRNVPAEVRERVEADAARDDVSRNDVIVRVLSARYGLPYESRSGRYTGPGESSQWVIRMPVRLREMIQAHARTAGWTQPGVVLFVLSEHYGLPSVAGRKRVERALPPETVAEARRRHEEGESIRALAREYKVNRHTLTESIRREAAA